jgi:hypothetical protein
MLDLSGQYAENKWRWAKENAWLCAGLLKQKGLFQPSVSVCTAQAASFSCEASEAARSEAAGGREPIRPEGANGLSFGIIGAFFVHGVQSV